MTKLTPLAVQNADLLRTLATKGPIASTAVLAKLVGRDSSNVRKSYQALVAAGLATNLGDCCLTAEGADMVDALDRADGAPATAKPDANAVRGPAGFLELRHAQIVPDPLNPRKHFDEVALSELACSIERDGLLENLVVRPLDAAAGTFRLVAGERRWRAMRILIEGGVWDEAQPIACKVVEIDDAAHRRIALVENLQRKDLRPIDEALALKELMAATGMGTAEVAAEIGFTQRFVQQRLQLLDLPEKIQDRVNAGGVSIEKAREAVALIPKLPAIKQLELTDGKITVDEAKAWLEAQPKPRDLPATTWLVALELFDALARRPMKKATWEYDRTEVGQAALEDEALTALSAAGMISGPNRHQDKFYFQTGRLYVSKQYSGDRELSAKFGADWCEPARLKALLAQLRGEAGISEDLAPGVYATPWLNPPFPVPEDLAAKYDARLDERKKADAKAKAERDKAEQEAARRQARAADNAAIVQEIVAALAARPADPLDPRFAQALADAGHPAPWRMDPVGRVTSADGREALYAHSYNLDQEPERLAWRALLVAAVNMAAGAAFTIEPDQQTEPA